LSSQEVFRNVSATGRISTTVACNHSSIVVFPANAKPG
jgi:hypothetical protein